MKKTTKRILIICMIILSITATACTAKNQNVESCTEEPVTVTQEPETTPTLTPQPTEDNSTPTAEPTPEKIMEPIPVDFTYESDESVFNYNQDEGTLTVSYSTPDLNGDIVYKNISDAWINELGMVTFTQNGSTDEVIFLEDSLQLVVMVTIYDEPTDSNITLAKNGTLIFEYPEFYDTIAAVKWFAANKDLTAIMYAKGELKGLLPNINIPEELRLYAEEQEERLNPDYLGAMKAQVIAEIKLAKGIRIGGSYPIDNTEGPGGRVRIMSEATTLERGAWEEYYLDKTEVRELYPDCRADLYRLGCTSFFSLYNFSVEEPLKDIILLRELINARILAKYDLTEENYYNYESLIYDPDMPVNILNMYLLQDNGIPGRIYRDANGDRIRREISYNGGTYRLVELAGIEADFVNIIKDKYIFNPGSRTLGEFCEKLGIEIPVPVVPEGENED